MVGQHERSDMLIQQSPDGSQNRLNGHLVTTLPFTKLRVTRDGFISFITRDVWLIMSTIIKQEVSDFILLLLLLIVTKVYPESIMLQFQSADITDPMVSKYIDPMLDQWWNNVHSANNEPALGQSLVFVWK